ncbi:rRNA methyltransferase [Clostridia bacterium]|nr:rRNA methyltransferase [Clostridia bacterium]
MKTIVSRDNPLLKSARGLRRTKGRSAAGAFLADGRKLIAEALDAGLVLITIFVSETAYAHGLSAEDQAFLECAERLVSPDQVIGLGERQYRELAGTETPQPFVAVFQKPGGVRDAARTAGTADAVDADRTGHGFAAASAQAPEKPSSILVLDRIGDPGNAGAMVRTAWAAGFAEVWTVKGTADPWSDKAIRAAAGSLFRMQVREGLSPAEVLTDARAAGAQVYALGMSGRDIYETNLRGAVALIVGNEGSGVQEILSEQADAVLAIPMAEGAESLNAAAAAAVALYEKRRQETVAQRV